MTHHIKSEKTTLFNLKQICNTLTNRINRILFTQDRQPQICGYQSYIDIFTEVWNKENPIHALSNMHSLVNQALHLTTSINIQKQQTND